SRLQWRPPMPRTSRLSPRSSTTFEPGRRKRRQNGRERSASAGLRGTQPASRRRAKPLEPPLEPAIGQRLLQRVELHIRGRHEQERQEETERLAADDRDGNRRALGAADTQSERGGNQAGDNRQRRHEDRA